MTSPVLPTLIATALLAASTTARADTVTEAEVIRLARTRDPQALAARASSAAAEAEEIRASLYPNPSIGWEREHLPAGAPATEDTLFVTVPLEFTGRRPAQRAIARAGTWSARARATRTQSDVVARSLDAFYAALAADRDVEIFARTVARLEEATRVVGRRHEEGTTSGYERARIEIERELARTQLHQAEAAARTARAMLAAMLGTDAGTLQLRGDFATAEPSPAGASPDRPSLRLFRTAELDARDAGDAARWAWLPTLSVSGGLRIGETTETKIGYVAGLSLSLPIFSHGQELVAESDALERLAAAEAHWAEREARLSDVRAREQLVSVRVELVRFTAATRERVELLERAALSGYREGTRSVVELLDAQRARTEVDRTCLDLEHLAKQAEVQVRAARGEFE